MGRAGALKDRFAAVKPRENSGATAANRFNYQADWALCLLIELHETGNDYLLVMEHHDDIVVLDSRTSPSKVKFYQVKTETSGAWTTTKLTNQKSGKAGKLPSIFGKLYLNYATFPRETELLSFVTNARASFKLSKKVGATESKGLTRVKFDELAKEEQSKLKEKLNAEFGTAPKIAGLRLFEFNVSGLSVTDHADHALGRLTRFLDSTPDLQRIRGPAFYRTLKGEVTEASV